MCDASRDAYRLHILIVEDDEDARKSLCDILELDDHSVVAANSVTSALELLDLSSFDVILLDRKLPDGFAEEFLPDFRRRSPQSDLIVVTGYADLEGTISALREGVTDYIIKPVNPEALLASLRRIGKRRQIERELTAERQFAQMILETAEAIVLVLDKDGKIQRFNPYTTQLTGYSLDEVIDQDWFETFIPERERERIQGIFELCLDNQKSAGIVNAIRTKDGQEREIRWSNTSMKNEKGDITGVLAVGLDVTDLARAQESLLQSERLAAIGQTMTGLAHESRNALQRLQNALDLLEDDLQDKPEALHDLGKIGRASQDLRDLHEEVRSYAAPINLDRSLTKMPAIWRRAWENLEARRKDRNANLTESELPSEVEINVDQKRIERVFRNLFENSLDACPDPLNLHIACRTDDDCMIVTIEDNGPGMSLQQKDQAFNAFYTTKPTGTGLGLAIVHRIIQAHDGTIKIESTDSGVRFVIHLPANPANANPTNPAN